MTTAGWTNFSPAPRFSPWQKPAEWAQYQSLYNNARIIATPRIQMFAGVSYYSSGGSFYLRMPPVPGNLSVFCRSKDTTAITTFGVYYPTSTGWSYTSNTSTTTWRQIGLTSNDRPWIVPYGVVAAASSWPDTYGTWLHVKTSALYEGSTYAWPTAMSNTPSTPAQIPRIGYPLPASNSHLSAVEYNALVDAAEQALYIPQMQYGIGSQSTYIWSLYNADQWGYTGYVEFDPTWDHPSQEIVVVAFLSTTSAVELYINVGGCPQRCHEVLLYGYLHVYRASWFNKPVKPAVWFDQRPRYPVTIATPGKSSASCYSLGVYTHVRP